MMNMGDAKAWWEHNVTAGRIDEKDPNELSDRTPELIVFLSEMDLITIHEALERQFIAKKKGRYQVLHAVYNVRRAMHEQMEREEEVEDGE